MESTAVTNGGPWRSLGQKSLVVRIRAEILRMIKELHLQPDERLPAERELASALEVSRASVREAVRALQAEGRLVVRHGRGVFVAEPPTQQQLGSALAGPTGDLKNLFAMRGLLEVAGARWAAERSNSAALEDVQTAYRELEEAIQQEPSNYPRIQEFDAAFHLRIVEATGNDLLVQCRSVLESLLAKSLSTTLAIPGRIEQSRADHAAIMAALLDGDGRAAARAAERHVTHVRDSALARIALTTE